MMGIDPGLKRVGLSTGDDESYFASPHKTLLRKDDASLVADIVWEARALGAQLLVMGLPLRMNGLEGPEAKRARLLAKAVQQRAQLEVVLWDERLTTAGAERQLRDSGMRGDKKKGMIDQAAATLLLQSYLDARRASG